MVAIPIAERLAILERNEGWFGTAPPEFRNALLAKCDWRATVVARADTLFARVPRRTRVERTAVPVTQDELAGLVDVSRTTLVQLLRGLERRRLAAQEYRAVRIVDVPGLESVAAGR